MDWTKHYDRQGTRKNGTSERTNHKTKRISIKRTRQDRLERQAIEEANDQATDKEDDYFIDELTKIWKRRVSTNSAFDM